MAATTRTRRKAVEPVVEETDDAFEELEEIDETDEDEDEVEEAPAPKTRGRKTPPTKATNKSEAPANAANEYGSAWLAEHVTEVTGSEYDGRGIRMLLRKIAKDPDGVLGREIGEDRTRYTFRGPNDPVVKAVVRMVKTGADKAVKREGLEKVKEAATPPTKRTRAKVEDEVEDAAPVRRTRKATTAKATPPAKATPARRTRARATS